jgi:DNA polymerase V
MTVYLRTSYFAKQGKYFNSETIKLPTATSYTPELIRHATAAAERMYRKNREFKKAGIVLSGLEEQDKRQLPLFGQFDRQRTERLMRAVDAIKVQFPDCNLNFAAEGLDQRWRTNFKRRSHRYTTKWDEIPVVA